MVNKFDEVAELLNKERLRRQRKLEQENEKLKAKIKSFEKK